MTRHDSLADQPILVADVGGTHIRIATACATGLENHKTWLRSEFESLHSALEAYLESVPQSSAPRVGSIAVAGPVTGDLIELTNSNWRFSIRQLRDDLGLEDLQVVNDFTAQAAAIPRLDPSETRALKEGTAIESAPIAVLGPGTGLGVSALIPSQGGWIPLSTEGGHADLAATCEIEWKVIENLHERFGRVSRERVLSGPGLVNLYRAVCEIEAELPRETTPERLVRDARVPASREQTVLQIFSGWLGAAARDLTLTFGARGGVFLAGGMVPKMLDVLDLERFLERFHGKGRFLPYLEPIPIHLVLNTNSALLGAAEIIRRKDFQ